MKRKEERKKGNDLHTNVTHGKASCVKFQRDREKKKKEIIKVHIARFFFNGLRYATAETTRMSWKYWQTFARIKWLLSRGERDGK